MNLDELLGLYSRVYGVCDPKLQFLDYHEIFNESNQLFLSTPLMSWSLFKQMYYNSLLYFFNEKAVIFIEVNSGLYRKLVSKEFMDLRSFIDSEEKIGNLLDNYSIQLYIKTGELFPLFNFNYSSQGDSISFEVKDNKDQLVYLGSFSPTTYYFNTIDSSESWRNTPVLLIQYDNTVKLW